MPQDHQNERPRSPPQGDDRTPDKTIGQVKYANKGKNTAKEGGGAYAPHNETESASRGRNPAKNKDRRV